MAKEYKLVPIKMKWTFNANKAYSDEMTRYAQEGWELVQIVDNGKRMYYIWKR